MMKNQGTAVHSQFIRESGISRAYSNKRSPEDFESANVAREQLQKIVDKFDEDAKPSTLQKLGFSHTPMKTKVADVLRNSIQGDIDDLKVSIDNLEIEWKEKNGPVCFFRPATNRLSESAARSMPRLRNCPVLSTSTKPFLQYSRHKITMLRS